MATTTKKASMAASLLPLYLCLLLLRGASGLSDQQAGRDSCDRIDRRIRALEPTRRVDSEAGHTELYDERDGQLPCAGVSAARITINRNGLLLPSYSNSPRLAYVIQGHGSVGVVIPGCPETYQETSSSSSPREQEDDERRRRGRRGEEGRRSSEGEEESEEEEESSRRSFEQSIRDEHQRITTIRQGDVVAIPAGAPFWVHNDGDSPLIAISVHDVSNSANQLDQTSRRFRLAGGQARIEGRQRYGEGESSESETERGGEESYNILSGFDTELLAESMRVSPDIARKLQGRNDKRGNIVRVRRGGLRLLRPATERVTDEEMMRGTNAAAAAGNGVDEALCLMKLRENVADPMKADLYTPNGGRITVLNSQKLPVLKLIKMSVNRGVMRRNAILAPHWNINAHAAVYATSGSARLQVVSSEGRRVFDGELRRGQMVVVPQSFAVVGRAGDEGFAWVSFQTSDNAMNAPVVGKSSALRGMPADVLANAFGVSREEARRVKFGRGQELAIFSPKSGAAAGRRSPGHRDVLAAAA
uniref:Cupin type-1 domain-containing protein n=1 Tax=Oryza punctata TaxID=4537 RepID=A0A0E0LQV4_ORYPU